MANASVVSGKLKILPRVSPEAAQKSKNPKPNRQPVLRPMSAKDDGTAQAYSC